VNNGRMDFSYAMCEGVCTVPHYGLLLAQMAGVPTAVSRDAGTWTSATPCVRACALCRTTGCCSLRWRVCPPLCPAMPVRGLQLRHV
jgi:hypothetical protein